ncbi:Uma2 family endonuclease [Thermus neutrinimicus]|uniref:Uma2 family endonuclease n=1 Tax=Thermus neutrinimicus TaxID=2908149 RepID=UPI001FAA94ED|nr:Uma2 family endonuclease [Thermus neutrinimicus]
MGEAAKALRPISLEEYLDREAQAQTKHELVEGFLHAMAGASRDHALLVTNLALVLGPLARRRGCRLFVADMKLKVGERTVYYPDLMVVCAPPPANPYYEEEPCLVVEVLSPTTEAIDRREKLWRYLSLPSLQGYILVHTQERRVELYRREGEQILYQATTEGELPLPCLEGNLPLAEAYAGVDLEAP